MKALLIYLKCKHCSELNEVDYNLPAQGCIKCGNKIVIPKSEKIIANTDFTD